MYQETFDVVMATTEELREQAYRLRYQVYCIEHPFEDPSDNPAGIEMDEFDSHAQHSLLVHRASGTIAGAVRLVLPRVDEPDRSFAIQQVCDQPVLRDGEIFPIARMGEISRFCISKSFRRRRGDNKYADAHDADPHAAHDERRVIPNITLGLMEALVRMSVARGITTLCAVMEPPLLRLLRRVGIYFEPIGPMVDYHGKRQPCMSRLDRLLERVRAEQPAVWEVLTDDGAHWKALCAMQGVATKPLMQ